MTGLTEMLLIAEMRSRRPECVRRYLGPAPAKCDPFQLENTLQYGPGVAVAQQEGEGGRANANLSILGSILTMNSLPNSDVASFLSLHNVERDSSCRIYALTPTSLAITVYRQQIRALNLAYAIFNQWATEASSKRIAVLGGGFAGITVTAGLLKKGFSVHLFEQRPDLCHLQSACETRALHPRIYEWPSMDSELADARLPLLNWSAGTAGDVARMVLRQFRHIVSQSKGRYEEYLRANARVAGDYVEWDNAERRESSTWLGRGGRHAFDAVVVAVGFGVETSVAPHGTPSYWRNDWYGQSQPGTRSERRELALISGDGDGALIDLVRVCLRGFKHDRLIDDLFDGLPALVHRLRLIRDQHVEELRYYATANLQPLLSQLVLEPETTNLGANLAKFRTRITDRLRRDTRAILNSKFSSFSQLLVADKRSFLNVVLAFCLYEAGAFSYIGGRASPVPAELMADINGHRLKYDQGIFRYGTERFQVMQAAGLSELEVGQLFKKQDAADLSRLNAPLWEPGWWSLPSDAATASGDIWWLEQVPRAELFLATTALGPLREHIRSLPSMRKCRFRATIHRTMHYASRANLACYQQLASYVGDAQPDRMKGIAGRVFLTDPPNKKAGAIGITVKTGVAVFAQHNPATAANSMDRWKELWNRIIPRASESAEEAIRFRSMDPELVTTVASVPIIANVGGRCCVRYILYVDVEHAEPQARPARDELLGTLWQTARGIVLSITNLYESAVDDTQLLVRRNQGCEDQMTEIPGLGRWQKSPVLEDYEWLQRSFGDFLHFEYPPDDIPLLSSAEVLELRPPV